MFDVLVQEQETLDWVYVSSPPSRAITCDLELGGEADCFLGQGVYSDGICVKVGYLVRIFNITYCLKALWVHQTTCQEYLHDCIWPGEVSLPFSNIGERRIVVSMKTLIRHFPFFSIHFIFPGFFAF